MKRGKLKIIMEQTPEQTPAHVIETPKPPPPLELTDFTEIPSLLKPIKYIMITDEKIVAFFENHFMEPTKFILSAIDNYKLSLSNKQPNSTEISNTELLKIQQEYNKFLNQKKSIISMWRENTKQLEGIEFENLDSVLCEKFGIVRDSFTCSICKTNSYRNKKALSVHMRKCKKNENCGAIAIAAAADEEEENDEESK